MYIKDDICYAGELTDNIKVTEAKPLRGGMMLVTFSSGKNACLIQQSCKVPLSSRFRTSRFLPIQPCFTA